MRNVLLAVLLTFSLNTYCEEKGIDQVDQFDASQSDKENDKAPEGDDAKISIALREIAKQLQSIATHLAPDQGAQSGEKQINEHAIAIGEEDLVQQTQMAKGTIVMAVAAAIGLIISGWGIWLLIQNLRQTKISTEAAQQSARAATKMLEENRAWICSASLDLKDGFRPGTMIITKIWKNVGRTPALSVEAWSALGSGTDPGCCPEIDTSKTPIYLGTVPPEGETHVNQPDVPLTDIQEIEKANEQVFIRYLIQYKTIYEPDSVKKTTEMIAIKFSTRNLDNGKLDVRKAWARLRGESSIT